MQLELSWHLILVQQVERGTLLRLEVSQGSIRTCMLDLLYQFIIYLTYDVRRGEVMLLTNGISRNAYKKCTSQESAIAAYEYAWGLGGVQCMA